MSQQQLDGTQVASLLIDLDHLRAPYRMHAVCAHLQIYARHPVMNYPRKLAGKFDVCMTDIPIHHALPNRQPDVGCVASEVGSASHFDEYLRCSERLLWHCSHKTVRTWYPGG